LSRPLPQNAPNHPSDCSIARLDRHAQEYGSRARAAAADGSLPPKASVRLMQSSQQLTRCNSLCTRLVLMKPPRPGGTENISVSMPSELLGALRMRTGKRGVSAYVAAAVRHQLAMDGLAEIVTAYEGEHEPLSEADVQAAQRELFGDAPAPYASGDSAA
jgi:hypothetical protein